MTDYVIPLGMSASALAKALNVPAPRINDNAPALMASWR